MGHHMAGCAAVPLYSRLCHYIAGCAIHPQLLNTKEVSKTKTQRVKVTQYDLLYLLSTKKQADSKRESRDESNMFKENIAKEMF